MNTPCFLQPMIILNFRFFERTGDGVDITNAEHVLCYKMDLPDRVSNVACMKNAVWMTLKNTDGQIHISLEPWYF